MSSRVESVWSLLLPCLFAAFVFWPWLVGVVDLAVWASTGVQWTSIPWFSERGCVLLLWPIGAWTLTVLGIAFLG